jgi:hypothetical protein
MDKKDAILTFIHLNVEIAYAPLRIDLKFVKMFAGIV